MLELWLSKVLPEGVDFIYIDNDDIFFNRVSDQNSFLKNPFKDSTIMCCEITYSPNDKYDVMSEDKLFNHVKTICWLALCKSSLLIIK